MVVRVSESDREDLEEQKTQPLVWVTVEDPSEELDRVGKRIKNVLPDHAVIVTTDELELIDATEMRDKLEEMIDDE